MALILSTTLSSVPRVCELCWNRSAISAVWAAGNHRAGLDGLWTLAALNVDVIGAQQIGRGHFGLRVEGDGAEIFGGDLESDLHGLGGVVGAGVELDLSTLPPMSTPARVTGDPEASALASVK